MLTHEPRTETRKGGYVRNHAPWIGTLWCVDCANAETIEDDRWCDAASLETPPGYPPESCDGCRKPITECSPLVVRGEAAIEHTPCKIF